MLEHLSIFIENKPGKLNRIVEILGGAGINIRAYSIAGAGAFGVLKILVDNPQEAAQLLFSKGLALVGFENPRFPDFPSPECRKF